MSHLSQPKARSLKRVYVWELPVRVYHWINAAGIVVLIVTGFLIANPPALMTGADEAYTHYWFGTTRFIHFATAYVLFFNFIFRLYWGFVGNRYADWRNFIPTGGQFFKKIWKVLKADIFLLKGYTAHSVGHNRMAGLIYFLLFIAFFVQCLTGFGLYAAMSDWWLPRLFSWVPILFGGDAMLRWIHHWTMWLFILFIVVHVYLVFYHDYVEGNGELSSMGGGWKFVDKDTLSETDESQPSNQP